MSGRLVGDMVTACAPRAERLASTVPTPPRRKVSPVSVQPSGPVDGHDLISLGGETAVVVPLEEYQLLKALKERASADEIEEAQMDAVIAEHEAWKAVGRPGAKSHQDFTAELAGGTQ